MIRDALYVSELFASLQGEGPSAGRRATFLRLGGCNLTCRWCDTAYTWDHTRYDLRAEIAEVPVVAVLQRVLATGTARLILTGGEPLLQQGALVPLVAALTMRGWAVEVETNATRWPSPPLLQQVTQWNLSPKLAHCGHPLARAQVPAVLRRWALLPNAAWKFVCARPKDLHEVRRLVHDYGVPGHRVWIMPEGTTPAVVQMRLGALVEPTLEAGYNLSSRLHVVLWGDARGH